MAASSSLDDVLYARFHEHLHGVGIEYARLWERHVRLEQEIDKMRRGIPPGIAVPSDRASDKTVSWSVDVKVETQPEVKIKRPSTVEAAMKAVQRAHSFTDGGGQHPAEASDSPSDVDGSLMLTNLARLRSGHRSGPRVYPQAPTDTHEGGASSSSSPPPALATLPPALATLPPALATLPPSLATLPPALATLPPALAPLPPALATLPSAPSELPRGAAAAAAVAAAAVLPLVSTHSNGVVPMATTSSTESSSVSAMATLSAAATAHSLAAATLASCGTGTGKGSQGSASASLASEQVSGRGRNDSVHSSRSVDSAIQEVSPSLVVADRSKKALYGSVPSESTPGVPNRGCVLSPASPFRLLWDLLAFLMILYEVWAFPFDMLFLGGDGVPHFMDVMYWVLTGFFTCDIVLNFCTGYITKGHILLTHREIARNYLRGYFWLDFLGTVPLSWLLEASPLRLSFLRGLKSARFLKTLRYVRLSHMVRRLQHLRTAGLFSARALSVAKASGVVVSLLLLTHVHVCVWILLDGEWETTGDVELALREYLRFFKSVFSALLAAEPLQWDAPLVSVFEMVIVLESILIRVGFGAWAVFTTIMSFEEKALMAMKHRSALAYLRQHNVSTGSLIQVLYGLHELGNAKLMQSRFTNLMQNDLPEGLRRTILLELWGNKLRTHGLIALVADWQPGLISELALRCCEEVFPSDSTLFRAGDLSFCSYFILSGNVSVDLQGGEEEYSPDYTPTMWLGEKALINPWAKRDATALTNEITRLMNVPAEQLHDLLDQFGLSGDFRRWCMENLWKGICGRCGQVGDHFSTMCPVMNERRQFPSNHSVLMKITGSLSKTQKVGRYMLDLLPSWLADWLCDSGSTHIHPMPGFTEVREGHQQELQEYLHHAGLERLAIDLQDMEVFTLDDLERRRINEVRDKEFVQRHSLTHDQLTSLTKKAMDEFRQERRIKHLQKQVTELLQPSENKEHFLFLSHFKLEAGTEAALMQSELEQLIAEDPQHPLSKFRAPVFLDTEDLSNLKELTAQVKRSQFMALLLTAGVLTRPWCLIEIVTAVKMGVPVLPVQIDKRGNEFVFPDRNFYEELRAGVLLSQVDIEVLSNCGISLETVDACVREVFKQISVRYSPHSPVAIRRAELEELLMRCMQAKANAHERMEIGPRRSRRPSSRGRMFFQQAISNFFQPGEGEPRRIR